jgi:hypothetical protein
MTNKCFAAAGVLAAAFLAVIFMAAPAQAAPNLTGVWKLNLSKSDYGQVPAPEAMTRTINHNDPSLQISTYQKGAAGEATTELKYTTDGKPAENKDSKGTAKWDGDKLVVDSTRNMQGAEIKFHEVWALSPEGKTLTVKIHLVAPQREADVMLVFDKQ